MKREFRITAWPEGNRLHVDLKGEFDGSSAFELLNFLQENSREFENFNIQTGELHAVHPAGQAVLNRNLPRMLAKSTLLVHFDGEKVSVAGCLPGTE